MAKVTYAQNEADWLIGLTKFADFEGDIFSGISTRKTEGKWLSFEAHPEQNLRPSARFMVRTEFNLAIGAYCIVLEGAIGTRPLEGICRYDVHDSIHPNNCRCCAPPPQIWPGDFHVHRYNECTIRRGNHWDKCATLLQIADNDLFDRRVRGMIGQFVDDMHIKFTDPIQNRLLFDTSKP
jgi:hypothetical protein